MSLSFLSPNLCRNFPINFLSFVNRNNRFAQIFKQPNIHNKIYINALQLITSTSMAGVRNYIAKNSVLGNYFPTQITMLSAQHDYLANCSGAACPCLSMTLEMSFMQRMTREKKVGLTVFVPRSCWGPGRILAWQWWAGNRPGSSLPESPGSIWTLQLKNTQILISHD